MPITALYAGLLMPLFVVLSVRVILQRRDARVALGDGGDASLLRVMRVHANFAEYVPLTLVLMALAESLRTSVLLLHAMGIALVAGRAIHAIGVSQVREAFALRVTGVATTLTVMIVAGVACLYVAV
jgi:uncharacterized protein